MKALLNELSGRIRRLIRTMLVEVKKAKTKKDALDKIQYFLGLVKEHKFDRIKEMIGALK